MRALLVALALAAPLAAEDFPMEVIHDTGNPINRVSILLVGDGFSAADIASGAYKTECNKIKDAFLAKEPHKAYQHLFRFIRLDVPSVDSGVSHEVGGIHKNTYFDIYRTAYFDPTTNTTEDYRLAWFRDSTGEGKLDTVNPSIRRDVAVCVINDAVYGGGGSFGGTASRSHATVTTHADSKEIFIHEMGHALVNLADEYEDGGATKPTTEPVEANVTLESDVTKVKWKPWVDAMPGVIGSIQGAMYTTSGVYRPKLDCNMRTLNQEFCEVCRERTIHRFYESVTVIEQAVPPTPLIELNAPASTKLSVFTLAGPESKIEGEWFIDGRKLTGTEAAGARGPRFDLDLTEKDLPPGSHMLRFVGVDKTPLIKNENVKGGPKRPNQRLWHIWVRETGLLPTLREVFGL